MFWPDMLRSFADRIEANPFNFDAAIDSYQYNVSPGGIKRGETIEIRLELPLPDIEKSENE